MPNVFKQPRFLETSGSVRIPDSPIRMEPPAADSDESDELEGEKAKFEPIVPTRAELMERCQDEINEIKREAAQQAYSDALNAKRGELQGCLDRVDAMLVEMQKTQQEFLDKYASELKYLAIDIAETILLTKIEEDDMALKDLVMQTVGRIRNAQWLDVQVSDKLMTLVEYLKAEFQKPEYRGRASVNPKPCLNDTVRVENQDGTVIASVRTQTQQLRESFQKDQ